MNLMAATSMLSLARIQNNKQDLKLTKPALYCVLFWGQYFWAIECLHHHAFIMPLQEEKIRPHPGHPILVISCHFLLSSSLLLSALGLVTHLVSVISHLNTSLTAWGLGLSWRTMSGTNWAGVFVVREDRPLIYFVNQVFDFTVIWGEKFEPGS